MRGIEELVLHHVEEGQQKLLLGYLKELDEGQEDLFFGIEGLGFQGNEEVEEGIETVWCEMALCTISALANVLSQSLI
jgi:hypothetical protein